ncbi:MAG TPA: histidine kinase [Chitinophagaceae bacterium]|nr:histidine kinase [Chitinophagaceae bacterium]
MSKRSFFFTYKLHHVVFWVLVFLCWFYLRYQDYATKSIAFAITFIKVADLALIVYIVNYRLIPRLLYKKKYAGFIASVVAIIAASGFIKMILMGEVTGQNVLSGPFSNLKTKFYENVISDFFLVTSGAAFKLIFDYIEMQQRLVEMAKEKAEAELSFLKSQINPHFLFNSLNAVYFLIQKENTEARQALHKFSDMLRYQLYEVKGTRIPIEKELSYLKDYVDLQKLRKDENYSVDFHCSPEVKEFSIEPLLLIPFVENAFKHLSHKTTGGNFVRLDITRSNGEFKFHIENSKEAERTTELHGGIGLNNVKRRLELLYPGKHDLNIDSKEDIYMVDLKLKIEQ